IQAILEDSFGGELSAYYTQLDDSPLARLHLIIQTVPGRIRDYDADAIEARLVDAARSWTDLMEDALVGEHGEELGLGLLHRYRNAFPPGYKEISSAATALADIACLEHTIASGALGMNLYRSPGAAANQIQFKIYNPHHEVPLSDILPMLEHMGLKVMDEVPHAVRPRAEGFDQIMIHDFGLETRDGSAVDPGAVQETFQDAFIRVWRDEIESDGFNGLVLGAGLTWRQVVILRTYCKYLRQAGIPFSQAYMEQTLANHPGLARLIVELFVTLFDPAGTAKAARRARRIQGKLSHGLEAVESADEDRILRRFLNVVEATLRTNYFQPAADGAPKPYLSVKLDSQRVDDLPLPRPMVEVFVYSPRVEAIHLRGGKVARGGIRWSDRREDFRTEILGLMKAQMVKNAVIVPVGAKGGFVVKRPPPGGDREALLNEGIACYKTLVRGLLDISDNYAGSTVVTPSDVVLGDGDDPYLVVAADKGTATFSDIANGISKDYGFWLGDAFASGGSVGYDHKGMGITARGAWESVKRHFREAGTDIQAEDFTVIGVGDMSGDVFGNGMLLSPHIKLVAAFNHLHIFVDPDPDPARSLKERQRLFALPRSSWSDYDAKLLSKGGAVFDRRAKSVTLTPEAAELFGVEERTMTPDDLLGIVLRASVSLLWFGGIGTFVKASDEAHADAGDRANDAVRIDATELHCKVIGEGANLGVTQRARVEYALADGRLNADSIDNSGGVDCSDHEVNIKILLDSVVASGGLTAKRRNALLARMTDEVAQLVLRNNYLQSQAITVVEARGLEVFDDQARMMRMLERAGRLNRQVEFLPDDEALDERQAAKKGFTRPEIAVLMPHLKIWLYDELLKSDLPDDPRLFEDLVRYFPTPLQKTCHDAIGGHRLRREIIATTVTNSMINRVGGSYVTQLMEKTGMTATDIAGAYIVARDVFAVRQTWADIEDLDNRVPARVQTAMLLEANRLIERGTLWFLRNAEKPLDIGATVAVFRDDVATLAAGLEDILPDHYRTDLHARTAAYADAGVPQALASRMAGMVNLASGCDIVRLGRTHDASVLDAAQLYFAVGAHFHMGRLRAAAESLEAETHWRQMAVAALIDDLFANQGTLASQILEGAGSGSGAEAAIGSWALGCGPAVEQTLALLSEVWSADSIDFSMLSVASRRLQALT
ncbi:MAG: NAD-glutamate dehydrogenase, partial [Rhodospirillales bacterium]|nr:NAD-glutamate dehydrogenase [Rhodospirillales bacterium]